MVLLWFGIGAVGGPLVGKLSEVQKNDNASFLPETAESTEVMNAVARFTESRSLPFVVVMVGLAVALVKDLATDPLVVRRQYAMEAVEAAVVAGVTEHGDDFVIPVEKDPNA